MLLHRKEGDVGLQEDGQQVLEGQLPLNRSHPSEDDAVHGGAVAEGDRALSSSSGGSFVEVVPDGQDSLNNKDGGTY